MSVAAPLDFGDSLTEEVPGLAEHIDLIRNNFALGQQELAARIYVEPGAYGAIVKDATEAHWEGNVFDTLGPKVNGTTEEIVEILTTAFNGPYVVASMPHQEVECPFNAGSLDIKSEIVDAESAVLKRPEAAGT